MKKLLIFASLIFATLLLVACGGVTTLAPTTVAPTTAAPTTAAPTTAAPTTVAPTTVAPTTVAPTTVAPTTVAPTTVASTTVAPTTEAPDTTAPVFFGVNDQTLFFGEDFDPLQGVMAVDDTDGILTSEIEISGTVDMETQGVYTLTYTVSDSAGNTATQDRIITVYASRWIIPNGEFTVDVAKAAENKNDPVNWGWHGNTGTMTAEISDGMAKIEILTVGTVTYGTQFYLLNRTVEQGKTYRISFKVRADAPRPLELVLENGIGGTRMFDNVYDMTTEWQEFTFDHYQFAPTIDGVGKFAFFAGNVNGSEVVTTYYLDYVRVEEVETPADTVAPVLLGVGPLEVLVGSVFDPLAGVSFTENQDYTLSLDDLVITGVESVDVNTLGEYTVTYTLADASGNTTVVNRTVKVVSEIMTSSFFVENGDFSKDQLVPYPQPAMDGWGWHGSGNFMTYIQGGVAVIDVYDTWRLFYGTQFYQQNRVLTEGQIYQITFKAKADTPRLLQVQLEGTGFTTVAAVFELTTEWQTFTFEYAHNAATNSAIKFGFFAGNIHGVSAPTKVYLDDVNIGVISELSEDLTAPQIWGVEDYTIIAGNDFDPLMGLKVYDHVDKTLTVDDIVIVSNTVDTSIEGVYAVEYSLTDVAGNTGLYSRTVTVINEIDAVDTRITFIDPDFELQTPITTDDNNQGWTLKTSSGGVVAPAEFVADRGGTVVKIAVSNVGTVPHGIQFHQMNQPGFVSEYGAIYRFSFWAKADVARDIAVQLQENEGWVVLMKKNVSITTEWAEYEVILVNGDRSYNKVKLGFFFGLIDSAVPANSPATTIYIDDVTIEMLGYVNDDSMPKIYAPDASVAVDAVFNPLTGVRYGDNTKLPAVTITSVTEGLVTYDALTGLYTINTTVAGSYVLTYTVTDMFGNELIYNRNFVVTDGSESSSLAVINGDFTTDQLVAMPQPAETGWGWHGSGVFTTVIEGGVATIDVFNTWEVFYGTQFYLQNRVLNQGETYLFTFKAKADEPRLLQMNLEASGMTTVSAIFELGTEWQTYTFEYTHTQATKTNVKFAFFAGNIHGIESAPTTVYLDDIAVDRIYAMSADTEAPKILGKGTYFIIQGNDFDPMVGLKPWDNQDRSLTLKDIKVLSNNVDTSTPGLYTVEYSLTDSSRNTTTYTRTVNVILDTEAVDTRITLIDPDFELQTPITTDDNNQGWTLKTSSGGLVDAAQFVADRDGTVVKINVTNVGTVPHGVQFHQMNQPGFVSEFGAMYKFSFWAKADEARDIAVQLQENTNWAVLSNKTVSISTEWVYYEVILVNNLRSQGKVKLGFFLGLIDAANPSRSAATAVYFDDVAIEMLGYVYDTVAPRILIADATINEGDVFDPTAGVIVGDVSKLPTYVITSATEGLVTYDPLTGLYTVDTSVAGVFTLTYTVTDVFGNETIHERTLTINEVI
ncbi:MAG: DUF5011 domain-containing protein [Candidatus Izemoplasmatales bacterium]|nr:DUF5011 domain-containing protein [Candidatus Izemoplasmatales bacterium]